MNDEVISLGELEIDGFDSANVPVDIWLTEMSGYNVPDADEDPELYDAYMNGCRWWLSVGNYMPRCRQVDASVCVLASPRREPLAELVRKHIIPFYRAALGTVEAIVDDMAGSLYCWEPAEESAE